MWLTAMPSHMMMPEIPTMFTSQMYASLKTSCVRKPHAAVTVVTAIA